jgi:predicted O-methyltransferase YrrM
MKYHLSILTFFSLILFIFNQESESCTKDSSQICKEQETYEPLNPSELNYTYKFSVDWTTRLTYEWINYLGKFKGKEDINFLEIGSLEGRTAIWLLEEILTHPTSRLTLIDNLEYGLEYYENFKYNMRRHEEKFTFIKESSYYALMRLNLNESKFDAIYVDGCHDAGCVIQDAVLSFSLLKPGGIIIFDDYPHKPPESEGPKYPIDAFLHIYKENVKVLQTNYQLIVEKISDFQQSELYVWKFLNIKK